MKRILILIALVALAAFAFGGCGGKADAKIKCDGGCGMELAKDDCQEIDGKCYCAGCAAHVGHDHGTMEQGDAEQAEKVACAGGCGMQMAQADCQEIDGKCYCAGCAAHVGHNH